MIAGVQIKVCGLTNASDAFDASSVGADYLGFIFYPQSSRYVDLEAYQAFQSELPQLPKVAVTVSPDGDLLERLEGAGFDYYQIHFPINRNSRQLAEGWAERLNPENIWLAPKVDPVVGFDESLLPFANTFLWDTYQKDAYGGTGKVGDWDGFRAISERFTEKDWVLAGGLNPDNVCEAIEKSGSKRIDLNSGVEKSPGVKDLKLLQQVKIALENR